MLRAVAFAAVVVYAHASRAASAQARAEQWMKTHGDPNDQAGMNDLKASDPNAFAIVQALLAKQQLGLLDPKHPTANFAGHAHEDDDSQSAIEVLKAAPTVEAPMAPVASMAAVNRHTYSGGSMWNFKQHQKSEDDELVNSVMGDVVGSPTQVEEAPAPVSTGSLLSARRSTVQSSAMDGDMATFGFGGQNSMANAEAREAEKPAPAVHRSFDGMPSLDWGARYAGSAPTEQAQPAPVTASMSQQMSSVSAVAQPIAQPVAQPAPVQKQAANPYLNGIDFSSDMSAQTKKASMAQQKLKTKKATPEELANNPYLQGIDLGQPAPAAQPQIEAPTPEASLIKKSSYLDQIAFPLPHRRIQQEAPKTPRSLANPLTEFSWHGEDRIAAPQTPVQTTMMQKVEEGITAARVSGPLSDWLAPGEESTPRTITAQIQEDAPSNANVDPMAMDKYNNWVQYGQ